MADKFVKASLTNTAKGPRGIAAKGGTVLLEAGQTMEVEVSQAELDDLPEHFKVKGGGKVAAKSETKEVDDKAYDKMSRGDLDAAAAERGIDVSGAGNKAEVVALLEADDKAKAEQA